MVQDLILAYLKADKVEACFILSGISFHSLGLKLDIVAVPKCAVMHVSTSQMYTTPKIVPFVFLKIKDFLHNYWREAICGVPAWVRWLVC